MDDFKDQLIKGDYVLATKWHDGDPMDHFCIGFFSGMTGHSYPRFDIVNGSGDMYRGNGFRRAEKITKDEGEKLVSCFSEIGDKVGPSLWWHLNRVRGDHEKNCDECKYDLNNCKREE